MENRQSFFEEQEINLLDLLIALLRRKRLIICGTLAFVVLVAAICFIVSPVYEATTKIMPPQSSGVGTASQLLGDLGGAASILLGIGAPTTTSDLYVGLLQTDAIVEPIIKRFDLIKLYNASTMVAMKKIVASDILTAEADAKSGIISVTIADQDPQRAADMANAFVEELKNLLENLAVTSAAKARLFLEGQLKKAHEALTQSEEAMQGFQESSGALKIDDQAAAILQGISSLSAQIAAKEVQIQVMKSYATPNNPDLKKSEEELHALREQLGKLQAKQTVDGLADVMIPTGELPTIGIEYIRKLREFKYNETLYELIAKQYEAARLAEAKEAAVVQVIYKATPPDQKAKPLLTIFVLVAGIAGIFMSVAFALFLDIYEKASHDPVNKARIRVLNRSLAGL